MQPPAKGGLGGVGMEAGVDQPVAVGWPAAQEAPLGGGLGAHRRPHPGLDPGALAFGHAAKQGHDQVVGFRARVDPPADLRHPQLHPVVGEDREGEAELVAVEGALRLADHHRGESALGIA
jgi:hypothetical protein